MILHHTKQSVVPHEQQIRKKGCSSGLTVIVENWPFSTPLARTETNEHRDNNRESMELVNLAKRQSSLF